MITYCYNPLHRPQPYRKELPRGLWVYLNRLPKGLSDVELQNVLAELGVILPLEAISIQSYDDSSSAKSSIGNEAICDLMNWLFNGKTLADKPLVACPVTSDRQGARHSARWENEFRR